MQPSFTLGIEEEYQTIDPETRDLRSHIETELMPEGKRILKERVKAELHQSVVEVGTGICISVVVPFGPQQSQFSHVFRYKLAKLQVCQNLKQSKFPTVLY